MSNFKKYIYMVEWLTDSNYTSNVHIQETIKANSLEEARTIAVNLWKNHHSGKGQRLTSQIWLMAESLHIAVLDQVL